MWVLRQFTTLPNGIFLHKHGAEFSKVGLMSRDRVPRSAVTLQWMYTYPLFLKQHETIFSSRIFDVHIGKWMLCYG